MIQRGAMHIVASLRLATYLVLLSVPIAHTFSFIIFVVASISHPLSSRSPALAGTGLDVFSRVRSHSPLDSNKVANDNGIRLPNRTRHG